MAILGLMLLYMGIGKALQSVSFLPARTAHFANRYVLYICLPAMVLVHVHPMDIAAIPLQHILAPVSIPWLVFLGAWAYISILANRYGWSREARTALILTAGLGNTSFVGFPLIQALYGVEGLQTAILLDQLGSFLVMSVLGIGIAVYATGAQLSVAKRGIMLLKFPPFVALCLGFALQPYSLPPLLIDGLQLIADTLVPAALISVGLQLHISRAHMQENWKLLSCGLGYKMLLAPLVLYIAYGTFMEASAIPFRVMILEAAMAPMITAGIIATEYKQRPDLGALMIGVGIPLSLITVPLMNYVLF